MSFRDIGVILNKAVEEKTKEREGTKQDDNAGENRKQRLSLSTEAYKLFCEGKTPIEVAIVLNLRESEATKFYQEYWKLKQLHNLNMVYEELRGNIEPFVKLYRLCKSKGMGVQRVVDVLVIANNDLSAIEKRFRRLRNDVYILQSQKHICERNLYQIKNQIVKTTRLLNSLSMSCIRKRREIEYLSNEKTRLEALIAEFKNNNEEYLKIKEAAEEKVKSILTNGKILLKFATVSVIESLRRNPELYNFVIHDNSNNATISYGSDYPSLMLSEQQQSFNDDIYSTLIGFAISLTLLFPLSLVGALGAFLFL